MIWKRIKVFPTRVGMNRSYSQYTETWDSVPHTRGDEPVARILSQRSE